MERFQARLKCREQQRRAGGPHQQLREVSRATLLYRSEIMNIPTQDIRRKYEYELTKYILVYFYRQIDR
jgi:hypothetical protein